jgi:GT2 family glycosyltransferase
MAHAPPIVPVSVVIPTYNRSAFTVLAVESVLDQSVAPQEIIVVDDGSTDETPTALERFQGLIRYVRRSNGGIARARNTGIGHARGRYVAFLDSDDLWAPRRLQRMVEELPRGRREGASAIATASHLCDADGRPTGKVVGAGLSRLDTGDLLVRHKGRINGMGVLVERELVLRLGGFREELACSEDCDLLLRLSRVGPILMISEPLLYYRCHHGNVSSAAGSKDAESWIRFLDRQVSEDPALAVEHAAAVRRCYASQYRRLGKRLLESSDGCPRRLAVAKESLWRSVRLRPHSVRTWRYVLRALSTRPNLSPPKHA